MPSPLQLDLSVANFKPIVGLVPPMSQGEPTWTAAKGVFESGQGATT